MRDAVRIFRLVLAVKLAFLALSFLTILSLGGPARLGLLLRAGPTLLLAILFLPPWLERALGRSFLAVGLGLDILFESLESASAFFDLQGWWVMYLNLPGPVAEHMVKEPVVEPFFFLLIPLVLLAWGYGRRGALWGSTWATVCTHARKAVLNASGSNAAKTRPNVSCDGIPCRSVRNPRNHFRLACPKCAIDTQSSAP